MPPFDFAPYIGPAMGILGGLFGGGPKVNPQAQADMNTSRQYLGDQSGVANKYGSLADYAGGNYGRDDPAARTATQNEIQYLQQNPNTNQADAQYLADATRGSDAAFQRGNANLTASLASRGFTGDSSILSGGLTSLAQTQAAGDAAAQNALAQHQMAQADANRRGVMGLEQGLAAGDYAHQTGAMGSQASLYGNLAGSYRGLGQYEQAQQNAQNQQQAAQMAGIGEAVGGIASPPDHSLEDAQTAYYNAMAQNAKGGVTPISPPGQGSGMMAASSGGGGFGTTPGGGFGNGSGGFGTGAFGTDGFGTGGFGTGVSPMQAPMARTASLSNYSAPVPPALMSLQTPRARAFVSYYQGGMQGPPPAGMDSGDVQDAVSMYILNKPDAMAAYRNGEIDPLNIRGN